jgi:hypothetical protein
MPITTLDPTATQWPAADEPTLKPDDELDDVDLDEDEEDDYGLGEDDEDAELADIDPDEELDAHDE